MAVQISASVGLKGINRHDDVVEIQKLLNKIQKSDGGPDPKLKVDGKAGPKTNGAIQSFQLKHFGWSGADGRVDPGKQTLAKLNEFDKTTPAVTSQRFRIRRSWDMPIIANRTETWFWYFEVQDQNTGDSAVYFFGNRNSPTFKPMGFSGAWHMFMTPKPYSVDGLECIASYTTFTHPGIQATNHMTLNLVPTRVTITGFTSQLYFADEGPEKKTYDLGGRFFLVK